MTIPTLRYSTVPTALLQPETSDQNTQYVSPFDVERRAES